LGAADEGEHGGGWNLASHRDDRLVMAAILHSVPRPPEMHSSLSRKRTARSALEAVKTVCVGINRVPEATARQLLKEFGEITFKEGENVDDFSLQITGLANNTHPRHRHRRRGRCSTSTTSASRR
jgi:hypothetical protein